MWTALASCVKTLTDVKRRARVLNYGTLLTKQIAAFIHGRNTDMTSNSTNPS